MPFFSFIYVTLVIKDFTRLCGGAETVCHPWNCVAAFALQAYQHCSYKEGSAGLVMLQDVLHRLARDADELEGSLRHGLPRSRPTLNRSLDRESSGTHDEESTGESV